MMNSPSTAKARMRISENRAAVAMPFSTGRSSAAASAVVVAPVASIAAPAK